MKVLILFFLIYLCTFFTSISQNLIQNGGFEEHGKIECHSCYSLYGKYPAVVYHWDNMGWGCFLCDVNIKQYGDGEINFCPLDRIKPQTGNCMVAMEYSPSTTKYGSMSSLVGRSTEPLEVGNVYEVSMWFYIERTPHFDPDWAKHIGVAVLPEKIKFNSLADTRSLPRIYVDTTIYDKWYQVKWQVRPLCNSNYLLLSVFQDEYWPSSLGYTTGRYYVDNIFLRKISVDSIKNTPVSNYCSRYDPKENKSLSPQMDEMKLLFESNVYDLSLYQRLQLDSFARYAKKYPDLVFEISGHTDSIGSNNFGLSKRRAESALNYLIDIQKLSHFRFITTNMGSLLPTGVNSMEVGRRVNRRVQIVQLNINLYGIFYLKAIDAIKRDNTAEAFMFLDKFIKCSPPDIPIYILFDPRFSTLKKEKRWVYLNIKIKNLYNKYKYPREAFLIDSLQIADCRAYRGLSWDFCKPHVDSSVFRVPAFSEEVARKTRKEHLVALESILTRTGWPKKTDFGEHISNSCFYILQHSWDVNSYSKWLPVIQQRCESGEMKWEWYAMLYDRYQLAIDKPQRYGTQYKISSEGYFILESFDGNKDLINLNRISIGLPPLSFDMLKQRFSESKINQN